MFGVSINVDQEFLLGASVLKRSGLHFTRDFDRCRQAGTTRCQSSKMLSTIARSTQFAFRSLRMTAPTLALAGPACRRSVSTNPQSSWSDVVIPDGRVPAQLESTSAQWLSIHQSVQRAVSKSAEETWAKREVHVASLPPPKNTWSGMSCYHRVLLINLMFISL